MATEREANAAHEAHVRQVDARLARETKYAEARFALEVLAAEAAYQVRVQRILFQAVLGIDFDSPPTLATGTVAENLVLYSGEAASSPENWYSSFDTTTQHNGVVSTSVYHGIIGNMFAEQKPSEHPEDGVFWAFYRHIGENVLLNPYTKDALANDKWIWSEIKVVGLCIVIGLTAPISLPKFVVAAAGISFAVTIGKEYIHTYVNNDQHGMNWHNVASATGQGAAMGLGFSYVWAIPFIGPIALTYAGVKGVFDFAHSAKENWDKGNLTEAGFDAACAVTFAALLYYGRTEVRARLARDWVAAQKQYARVSKWFAASDAAAAEAAPSNFVTVGPAGPMYGQAKPLTPAQRLLLELLPQSETEVIVSKRLVSMNDLRNLTLHTGDEFAKLTRRGERLILRGVGSAEGSLPSVPQLTVESAKVFARQGWRFSGHTHTPGYQAVHSIGDQNVLRAFGQRQSAVWGAEWGSTPGRFFSSLADEINFRRGLLK